MLYDIFLGKLPL